MQITVSPCRAHGRVAAPPSKSMAHRLLIAAGLAAGVSTVRGISSCEDVLATLDCLRALGVEWERHGDDVTLRGIDPRAARPQGRLLCRESGSTLRFLLPIALLSGERVTLDGSESLLRRPMDVYETLCRTHGMEYCHAADGITVRGPLRAGIYEVPGNISSQFISGLLFALPLAEGESEIRISEPIESRSYLELTLSALHAFGVRAAWSDSHTLVIPGGQRYLPQSLAVEGDYSNAAFLDAFGMLGDGVTVEGLREDSLQGDRVYRSYFTRLLAGRAELSIADCPDLGPILFALAAARCGGVFHGTARLRIKESDRAAAMAEELSKLGIRTRVDPDTVTVEAGGLHAPREVLCGHNDHRIVMALTVLLTLVGGSIRGAEAMDKSFPDFLDRMRAIGLEVTCREEA